MAESVFDGVRARLKRMEAEVAERDNLLAQAKADAAAQARAHAAELGAVRQQGVSLAAAVRAERDEAVSRHLAFIDRLMADKDELARALAATGEAVQVSALNLRLVYNGTVSRPGCRQSAFLRNRHGCARVGELTSAAFDLHTITQRRLHVVNSFALY